MMLVSIVCLSSEGSCLTCKRVGSAEVDKSMLFAQNESSQACGQKDEETRKDTHPTYDANKKAGPSIIQECCQKETDCVTQYFN